MFSFAQFVLLGDRTRKSDPAHRVAGPIAETQRDSANIPLRVEIIDAVVATAHRQRASNVRDRHNTLHRGVLAYIDAAEAEYCLGRILIARTAPRDHSGTTRPSRC